MERYQWEVTVAAGGNQGFTFIMKVPICTRFYFEMFMTVVMGVRTIYPTPYIIFWVRFLAAESDVFMLIK